MEDSLTTEIQEKQIFFTNTQHLTIDGIESLANVVKAIRG